MSDRLRWLCDLASSSQTVANVLSQKLNKVLLFHRSLRCDVQGILENTVVLWIFDCFLQVRSTGCRYGVRCHEIQCGSLLRHRATLKYKSNFAFASCCKTSLIAFASQKWSINRPLRIKENRFHGRVSRYVTRTSACSQRDFTSGWVASAPHKLTLLAHECCYAHFFIFIKIVLVVFYHKCPRFVLYSVVGAVLVHMTAWTLGFTASRCLGQKHWRCSLPS